MVHFHGSDGKAPFFEGWYFRHRNKGRTIALIPGMSRDRDGGASAFIQVITDGGSWQADYGEMDFHAARDRLAVRVGGSVFTEHGIRVNIDVPELRCTGTVRYGGLTTPRYDIMGPFGPLPFLECYHGLTSLYHRLGGSLTVNGERFDLDGGTGYIEKDWGRSFPRRYTWVQCNDLTPGGRPCCVFASAAEIPLSRYRFDGCIDSVWLGGREYRLATYLGGKAEEQDGRLVIHQGAMRLTIQTRPEDGQTLRAPDAGGMTRSIRETLTCPARFTFRRGKERLLDAVSRGTSYERVE